MTDDARRVSAKGRCLSEHDDEWLEGVMNALRMAAKDAHLKAYLTGTGVVTRRNGKVAVVAPDPAMYEDLIPPPFVEHTDLRGAHRSLMRRGCRVTATVRPRPVAVLAILAVWASLLAPAAAAAAQQDAGEVSGTYPDTPADAYYAESVAQLAERGVFAGTLCDAGFCPGDPIDRKTMAVWVVRVLGGEDPEPVSATRFDDVDAESFYAPFIVRMAELGVTQGCGDGSGFCPDRTVDRAQMAAFLSRAYSLADGPDPGFTDVADEAWYAADVARLAASGITRGCGDGTRFCPDRDTTRGQMATFLHRAAEPGQTPKIVGDAISISFSHGCAVKADQTIACWGDNTHGQASPPAGRFAAVAVGHTYSCALRTDKTVVCWGENSRGRTDVPSGTYTDISANYHHPCALHTDGTIRCWGDSPDGYPGGGSTDRPPSGTYTDISLSQTVGCGIRTDQSIQCWGWTSGSHGLGTSRQGTFTAVDVTDRRACALRTDATIDCWTAYVEALDDAPAGSHIDVSVGGRHDDGYSCALRTDLTITCWGEDTATSSTLAGDSITVIGLTSPPTGRYQALALAYGQACALRVDNTHICWGGPAPPIAEAITVTLSPSILNVAEGGTSSYSISLSGEPAAPITIRIEVPTGSDLSANRSSIAFDESNWRTPQFIAVTAAQDDDTEWNQEGIDHTLTSTEPAYSSIIVPALSVVVQDDDTPIVVTDSEPPEPPTDVTVDWREGTSITVTWQPSESHGPTVGYALEFLEQPAEWPYYELPDIGPKVAAEHFDRLREDFFGQTSIALVKPTIDLFWNDDGTLTSTIYFDWERNAASYLVNFDDIEGVRVVASNQAGFAVSDPVYFVNERVTRIRRERELLRGFVEDLVDQYGDDEQWLADVWSYIVRLETSPVQYQVARPRIYGTRYHGFSFGNTGSGGTNDLQREHHHGVAWSGSCAADPDCIAGIGVIFDPTGMATAIDARFEFHTTRIAIHELAHVFSVATNANSSPLAIAAGFMYMTELVLAHPRSNQRIQHYTCSATELYADAATQATLMSIYPDNTFPQGTYIYPNDSPVGNTPSLMRPPPWRFGAVYRSLCGLPQEPESVLWTTDQIDIVRQTLNGDVPAWFTATYQRSDGSWDRNKVCSTVSQIHQPSGSAVVRRALSTHLGIGECDSAETNTEQQDPTVRFEAVSAGGLYSCGLRTDGTITCWGHNQWGQTDAPSGTFSAVSASRRYSCGLRTDGTITCWGDNSEGQTDAPSGTFSAVSAGHGHACGLRTDGTITCWSKNHSVVTDVPFGTFSAVSAGQAHSCGLRTDDTITCWPDWADDAPSGIFSAVSANHIHSCGLRTDGTITCWGSNSEGQTDAPSGTFSAVSAGEAHSCGLRTDGTITCWGHNSEGQADAPSGAFSAVSAGGVHSCGLRTDGTITCWGDNHDGRADPP